MSVIVRINPWSFGVLPGLYFPSIFFDTGASLTVEMVFIYILFWFSLRSGSPGEATSLVNHQTKWAFSMAMLNYRRLCTVVNRNEKLRYTGGNGNYKLSPTDGL